LLLSICPLPLVKGWGESTEADGELTALGGMPVAQQVDIPSGDASGAGAAIASFARPSQEAPTWMMFRSVLTSPSYLASVRDQALSQSGGAAVAVGPHELSYLMRASLRSGGGSGSGNDDRVSYVSDTLPSSPADQAVAVGSTLRFTVTVRNDGWNDLGRASHKVAVTVPQLQPVARLLLEAQAAAAVAAQEGGESKSGGEGEGNGGRRVGRGVWASAGLVDVNSGARGGRSLRKALARDGFVGDRPIALLAPRTRSGNDSSGNGTDAAAYFSLPADLPAGGEVVVSCQVEIPSLNAINGGLLLGASEALRRLTSPKADVAALLEVSYQLVEVVGDTVLGFDRKSGIIPWEASVAVANTAA
jgi:hypothetical protein